MYLLSGNECDDRGRREQSSIVNTAGRRLRSIAWFADYSARSFTSSAGMAIGDIHVLRYSTLFGFSASSVVPVSQAAHVKIPVRGTVSTWRRQPP
jgi:hypothetical protein